MEDAYFAAFAPDSLLDVQDEAAIPEAEEVHFLFLYDRRGHRLLGVGS